MIRPIWRQLYHFGSEQHENRYLNGLTSLSDVAAQSLSNSDLQLYLDLAHIPESAAAILRNHPSFADED